MEVTTFDSSFKIIPSRASGRVHAGWILLCRHRGNHDGFSFDVPSELTVSWMINRHELFSWKVSVNSLGFFCHKSFHVVGTGHQRIALVIEVHILLDNHASNS